MTGFTTQGEEEEGVMDTIKSWNRPTIEQAAATSGAKCELFACSAIRLYFLFTVESCRVDTMSVR